MMRDLNLETGLDIPDIAPPEENGKDDTDDENS